MLKSIVQKFKDKNKGWIIGKFAGALLQENFEIGIKEYKCGDTNPRHLHKLAKEINIIISGKAKFIFDDKTVAVSDGDIVVIEENEPSAFEAEADTILLVIKTVSDINDKYTS